MTGSIHPVVRFRLVLAVVLSAAFACIVLGCDDNGSSGDAAATSTTSTTPLTTIITSPTTTSTTTSTSTTVTSTSSTSTSNTFFVDSETWTCTIEISQTSNETLGALQWDTAYVAHLGVFLGAAGAVNCTSPLSAGGAIVTFNDDEASATLRTAMISLAGFTGPTVVAECKYESCLLQKPAPDDFALTLVAATDPAFAPRTPTLAISAVACELRIGTQCECFPFDAASTSRSARR
jgi:hypothetical protein